MALNPAKYKRVPDLYVTGKELVLSDGTVMWMQVLNPMERDEAQHDAQVARSRLMMALKSPHGGVERDKVVGAFLEEGRDAAIEALAGIKTNDHLLESARSIRDDPEWKERIEILDRLDGIVTPAEEAEVKLLEEINGAYMDEVRKRQDDERAFQVRSLTGRSDEELISEYIDVWAERRGGEVARTEYELTELWYAARCCEGLKLPDSDKWDHAQCEGHSLRIFDSKEDIHSLPEELQDLMREVMGELAMSVRDAKNSARQGSSSGSSPLPSEAEGSTPSTPTETHEEPPGTSSTPSATP